MMPEPAEIINDVKLRLVCIATPVPVHDSWASDIVCFVEADKPYSQPYFLIELVYQDVNQINKYYITDGEQFWCGHMAGISCQWPMIDGVSYYITKYPGTEIGITEVLLIKQFLKTLS